jgi:hypothetical protein
VSFKDVTFRLKKLSWPSCLKVAPFLLSKKTAAICLEGTPFVWKERHLFEGKVLLTKKKIESV